jgi:putative phosphoesterase
MNILLISDTHGDTELIKKVIQKHKNVDLILHAGDSQLPPFLMNNILTVKGNCDYEDYPIFRDLFIEGFKIHIEHGHRIKISDLMFLENNDFDIVIFGHTHCVKTLQTVNEKYFFNPGSLARPRDSSKGSYIILTLKNKTINYEIYRIDIES